MRSLRFIRHVNMWLRVAETGARSSVVKCRALGVADTRETALQRQHAEKGSRAKWVLETLRSAANVTIFRLRSADFPRVTRIRPKRSFAMLLC